MVEGYKCSDIVMKASQGTIEMDNVYKCIAIYIAPDSNIHSTTIQIGVKTKKGIKWIEEKSLDVLRYPDPVTMVGGHFSGDTVLKVIIASSGGVSLPVLNDIHLAGNYHKQKVTSYALKITRNDSILFEIPRIEGNEFPEAYKDFVHNISAGDLITIFNIEVLIFEKERRTLPTQHTIYVRKNK
jgi:hypothetical protein